MSLSLKKGQIETFRVKRVGEEFPQRKGKPFMPAEIDGWAARVAGKTLPFLQDHALIGPKRGGVTNLHRLDWIMDDGVEVSSFVGDAVNVPAPFAQELANDMWPGTSLGFADKDAFEPEHIGILGVRDAQIPDLQRAALFSKSDGTAALEILLPRAAMNFDGYCDDPEHPASYTAPDMKAEVANASEGTHSNVVYRLADRMAAAVKNLIRDPKLTPAEKEAEHARLVKDHGAALKDAKPQFAAGSTHEGDDMALSKEDLEAIGVASGKSTIAALFEAGILKKPADDAGAKPDATTQNAEFAALIDDVKKLVPAMKTLVETGTAQFAAAVDKKINDHLDAKHKAGLLVPANRAVQFASLKALDGLMLSYADDKGATVTVSALDARIDEERTLFGRSGGTNPLARVDMTRKPTVITAASKDGKSQVTTLIPEGCDEDERAFFAKVNELKADGVDAKMAYKLANDEVPVYHKAPVFAPTPGKNT